jgi:hypothetical protein
MLLTIRTLLYVIEKCTQRTIHSHWKMMRDMDIQK